MNAVLINRNFYSDAMATGIPIPPQSGFHSTADKLFIDADDPRFPNILRIAVLRYHAGCKRARQAMKWFSSQITEQDRQKILERIGGKELANKNPSFGSLHQQK